jgi:glutaredoxin
MPRLTLYTKPDCHLCEEARAALERVRNRVPFELEAVDISTDPRLGERYGTRIPVVFVDGREAFEYEVDERELERLLAVPAGAKS